MNANYEALKKKKGVSDYQVAKDTGVSRSTLSEWNAGKYIPKTDKLLKLAKYFNVSIEYLLGEKTRK